MFKYKNAMISMAVVAMLAACGGGGGGDDDDNGAGGGAGGGGAGAGDTVVTDVNLSGAAANLIGIVVPQGQGTLTVSYPAFNDTTPRTPNPADGDPGGYGTFTGEPRGTASPLRIFGISVADEGVEVADDSKSGRLVFQLQDNDAVAAAERENLSIEIDNITTTRTAGEISIALVEGAQVHVSARNNAGQESGVVSIAATPDMFTVVDNAETNDIILNVDAIVAAAAAAAQGTAQSVLASASGFGSTVTEPFAVSMTLTNVDFASAGTATAGTNVKVGTRNTVSGEGGVSGYVQSIAPDAAGG